MSEDIAKILEAIKRLQDHVDNRFNEIENRIADISLRAVDQGLEQQQPKEITIDDMTQPQLASYIRSKLGDTPPWYEILLSRLENSELTEEELEGCRNWAEDLARLNPEKENEPETTQDFEEVIELFDEDDKLLS